MKRSIASARAAAAALAVTALAATAGCSASASADDTVVLTLSDGFSATHPAGKGGSQKFVEYVAEHGADVGLEIDYFGAGQLSDQSSMLPMVRTGAIDIGWMVPSNVPANAPLAGVGDLPKQEVDACAATDVLVDMMQPGGVVYENELDEQGLQVLWGYLISDFDVFTKEPKVTEPSDLHGYMLRSAGGPNGSVVSGLGATPVELPTGEMYEAIARGTVDGIISAKYVMTSYGLQDEIEYATLGAGLGATTAYMVINPDVWEGLTPDQQSVIAEASAIAQRGACDELVIENEKAMEALQEGGVEFTEIPENDRAAWDAALETVQRQWVEALAPTNPAAAETLDTLNRGLEEVAE